MLAHALPGGALDRLTQEINAALGPMDGTRTSVFVDGQEVAPGHRKTGRTACIFKTNDKTLDEALGRVDVEFLHLHECRAVDLSAVATHSGLRGLSIEWAPKITDLSWIETLHQLEALSLFDLPKLADLGPLAALSSLKGLALSGGMSKGMRVYSLAPIGALRDLRELSLMSIRCDDPEGIRPLKECEPLDALWLPNTFETADFAYLSTQMPATPCARFAAYERLERPINGMNVMVTGKRKPLLSLPRDAAKATRFEAAFARLKGGET